MILLTSSFAGLVPDYGMRADLTSKTAVEEVIRKRVPRGCWGTVDDIAEAILFSGLGPLCLRDETGTGHRRRRVLGRCG